MPIEMISCTHPTPRREFATFILPPVYDQPPRLMEVINSDLRAGRGVTMNIWRDSKTKEEVLFKILKVHEVTIPEVEGCTKHYVVVLGDVAKGTTIVPPTG